MISRALRAGALALAAAVGLTGCAIQGDNSPRDIAAAERPALEETNPAGQATGSGRVFLVANETGEQPRLRSVLRNARDVESAMSALLEGANTTELEERLTSALPPELTLNSSRVSAGVLHADLSDDILELSANELRLAVAQLVFTASELPGVRAVQLRVDGEAREWPNGRGELQAAPLTVYDFPGLAESTQPAFPPIPVATP